MSNLRIFALLSVLVVAISSSHAMSRIVGGHETTIELRPYQASLQYHTPSIKHVCGASIITAKFLLTAAQCEPSYLGDFYARVGSTAYNAGGQVLKVATFVPHHQFNAVTLDYDLALIGFGRGDEILFGPNVAVVALVPAFYDPVEDIPLTVTGWGSVKVNEIITPTNLHEVNLSVVQRDACKSVYESLTLRQICLGNIQKETIGTCIGDAGGAAVQDGIQYGVVSRYGCGRPGVPNVFTRISAFRVWIWEQAGV